MIKGYELKSLPNLKWDFLTWTKKFHPLINGRLGILINIDQFLIKMDKFFITMDQCLIKIDQFLIIQLKISQLMLSIGQLILKMLIT